VPSVAAVRICRRYRVLRPGPPAAILLLESIWKPIWLAAVALPKAAAGELDAATQGVVVGSLFVIIMAVMPVALRVAAVRHRPRTGGDEPCPPAAVQQYPQLLIDPPSHAGCAPLRSSAAALDGTWRGFCRTGKPISTCRRLPATTNTLKLGDAARRPEEPS
jgi:hypothetical protein